MIGPILRRYPPTGPALFQIGSILLAATLFGACQSASARPTLPRLETAYSAAPVSGGVALVSLPNSGPVASVQETRSTAGLRQRIILGQSRGRIDLTVASGRVWDDPAMEKPSRIGIAAELATLENGGSYRIVRRPMGNAYGALGVAVNERCAYAWQWIDALPRPEQQRFGLRGPVSVSLRVHHCLAVPTAAETLLADLAQIRFGRVANAISRPRRPRVARPKPEADTSVPVAAAPARTSTPEPTVAVNGSRTLVTVSQGSAAQPFLAPPAPATAEPTVPTVPRPATAGTDRSRFLTDALPPSGRASIPNPQSAEVASPTRPLPGSRPPAGW